MMLKSFPALCTVAVVLAACGGPDLPPFQSEQEKQCYLQTLETLQPNQKLIRASGTFALVTTAQGFTKAAERSQVYESCMQRTAPGSLSDAGTLQLSDRELLIWDSLSDAEKRAALEFVQKGGTFGDFVKTLPG